MAEGRIFRMEGERDERDKAVGFVLQLAQQQQVLDALLFGFDMAVKHGRVRAQAELVRGARDVQPLLAAHLVVADHFAHPRVENFGAAAGQRVHARFLQRQQGIADRKLRDTREVAHLDHGERLQVHSRAPLLQPAHQVEEILERQIGMQAADQMELRRSFADTLLGALEDLFERKRVGPRRVRAAAKGAQPTVRHADISRIDVAVDVEIADVAVALLADVVAKPADGQQVWRAIERDAVVKVESLAGQNLVGNRF